MRICFVNPPATAVLSAHAFALGHTVVTGAEPLDVDAIVSDQPMVHPHSRPVFVWQPGEFSSPTLAEQVTTVGAETAEQVVERFELWLGWLKTQQGQMTGPTPVR